MVEKIWQQRLFFEFKDWKDELYVYDLEFSQPFPDKNKLIIPYAKKHGERFLEVTSNDIGDKKGIKSKLKTNSPDMFAIRFKDRKPVSLVMIEVKSTQGACVGDSDIEKHLEGMQAYSKQEIFMRNRREDAYKMLNQFKKFGFLTKECNVTEIPKDIKVESILLLTNNYSSEEEREDGGAITYFKNNKQKVLDIVEKYNCQLWLTKNLYTDEKINFTYVQI